jgi:cobalt-zinc-cadmium efflux system outer membrane protein
MRHLLSVLLLALPMAAWTQTPSLTEAEAVRRALARSELANLEQGALEAARADALAAGQWPNPTLDYSRERLRGSSNASEESWQISQAFDLSGRRGLRREAAERRVEAVSSGNEQRRHELAAETRRRFHETLYRQEVVRAGEAWAQQFVRVERVIDRLARAGEASGFDRRRLLRERQTAEARLASERGELDRARARLLALIDSSGKEAGEISGALLPAALPPLDAGLSSLNRRPDLQALARRAEAADLDGRAAARGWLPEVTVGVGPKRVDDGSIREHGTVVSLSLPLPVFDRQQAGGQRAAAEAVHARGEYGLVRARAEGELRGLHRQTERLVAAAADYRARATAASADLLRIAEAAYQGGETSLLELLDAYRGALEATTTVLDLEWKARQARIDYDLLTGSISE